MRYLLSFFLYSVLGWAMDAAFKSHLTGLPFDAILRLPFTPIYGLGALLVLWAKSELKETPIWAEFIIYTVILTLLEYMGGVFALRVFGRRYWDYSSQTYNINGFVSLWHSLIWGLLALLLVYVIHPQVKKILKRLHLA